MKEMKQKYSSPLKYILVFLFLFTGCQQNPKKETSNDVFKRVDERSPLRKSKKDPKKGIEHIAEYQDQIRKGLNEEVSTYRKGYLITEYNKAAQKELLRKSKSAITPIFIERGPYNVPGRSRGIVVDPTNSNKWYVGSVGGGVWLTEDGGTTWANLTDFKIPNLATSTIAISQTDSNTLYIGTGEPFGNLDAIGGGGVFKTIDGGTTWKALSTTASFGSVGRIIVNPTDKEHVVIATTSGIYRTVNGGETWVKTYKSTSFVQDLDADPSNFNIQYGSVNNLGIVKSTDGGASWFLIFNKNSFNPNHRRFETAVSPANPKTIFLSVYSPSGAIVGVNTDFYVSRDRGKTFTSLGTNGTAEEANLVTGQGWYNNALMAHPYDVNTFYVGGVAVFKVTIAADTFTSTSIASGYDSSKINSNVHVDQHGLFSVLGTGQEFRILLVNDGGVYSTTMKEDPGATKGDWSVAVTGKNSTQFYGATKQNGQDNYLAGAQDNGSWRSIGNDATKTKLYQKMFGGDGFEVIWHYNNPGDFIVTAQRNSIARYINYKGVLANFSESRDDSKSPFYTKIANSDKNPDVIFAVSSSGVWRSTDFAGSWNLTPILNKSFAPGASSALDVAVSPADPNIVWAGAAMTESGSFSLFVSQDNGLSFSKTSTFNDPSNGHNYYLSGLGTSQTEKNRAYALFSSQGAAKILKTEDLGATWTDLSGFSTNTAIGFPDVAVHSILEMPFDPNLIWVGTDIGIFETENGGISWNLRTNFPAAAVYDMKVVNDQVVIATHGRGIWSATISELNSSGGRDVIDYLDPAEATIQQKEIDSRKAVINYSVIATGVTRAKFFIDGIEIGEITQGFIPGEIYTFETLDLDEGVRQFGIQLFDDTKNLETLITNQELSVIDFEDPGDRIHISEFKATDVFVYDSAFKIDNLDGNVTSLVLNNSEHPYQNDKTYMTVLKQPLTISGTNNNFSYEDVVLVEAGYDFVTIEASTDLKTWTVLDTYDVRRYPEWVTEFNKGPSSTISDTLFKTQNIVLTDKGFSIGDTIVFRFKLVTDEIINSYGWAIRSINNETFYVKEISTKQKEIDSRKTIVNYSVNVAGATKAKFFIDGIEVAEITQDFKSGEMYTFETSALAEGVYSLGIQVFEGEENLKNPITNQNFTVIDFKKASTNISISEFNIADVFVYNSSFKIDNLEAKVTNLVLSNSEYPYQNNKTGFTVLKQPLTISEANKFFSYEDVAIVEPYTDDLLDLTQFFDYVTLEASTDLETWVTLDTYDARRFPEWLEEFSKGTSAGISDELFKTQNIVLTDKGFSIGETIVFRFKLVTNSSVNSYGWAIRSINSITASTEDVLKESKVFEIYPTVSKGDFTIFAKNTLGKVELHLFDNNGKEVYSKQLNFTQQVKQSVSVNLTSGIYIVNLIDANKKKATSKIIIK
jgi:photosystem II stability/assembly factor-like uncharacterized protein